MTTPLTANTKTALAPDDLGHQIEILREDLMKLAATLSNNVSEGIGQATHKVGQTGRDAQASASNAVLGHPLTAVALAASVGLLLGLVLRKG